MENILRRLTPRLKMIADLTPESGCAADIGSDHGYVAIALHKTGRARKIIVSDINKGPLERARRNIDELCGGAAIETRLSDGLLGYGAGEVETVIIAGMGGELIIKILSEADPRGIRRAVLQPMTAADALRRFLHETGWRIAREDLAREGKKFYAAILAEKGEEPLWSETEYQLGKHLIENRHPLLRDYIGYRLDKINRALDGQKKAGNPDAKAHRALSLLKEDCERLIKECGEWK